MEKRDERGYLVKLIEHIEALEVAIQCLEKINHEEYRRHRVILCELKQQKVDECELERARHRAFMSALQT